MGVLVLLVVVVVVVIVVVTWKSKANSQFNWLPNFKVWSISDQ